MSNIILNQTNIVNSNNNKLSYKFPRNVTFQEGAEISLTSMNLYYSWFNISSANNNNFFQYLWWDIYGILNVVVDVIIPDGYYSVADLNEFLISEMVRNGHYLTPVESPNNNVYFIEFLTNSTYYSVELRLSSMSYNETMEIGSFTPDTGMNMFLAPTGWTMPSDDFECPKLIIPTNNNFGKIIGFNSGTIEPATIDQTINKSYTILSQITPQLEPQSTGIIKCNLVKNNMSSPNDVLTSFSASGVGFGDMVKNILNTSYSKIAPGTYDSIDLEIVDQHFLPINIIDFSMLFVLHITE